MKEYASKSDYRHAVEEVCGITFILIEDLNLGRMSVTNNIENIIEMICYYRKLDANKIVCWYKDSEGRIDGYDYKTECFYTILNSYRYIDVSAFDLREVSTKLLKNIQP